MSLCSHPFLRAELVQLASKILNSVAQYDKLMENEAQVEVAQAKFDDIMNLREPGGGVQQDRCPGRRQQLDSTLMLMITKAWAAAKESNMMKDEVRVIMSCTVLSRQRFSLIVTVWLPLCWVYRQDLNCMLIFRKSWAAAKESASARECCCTVELPHSLYGCAAVCLCACVSVQVKDVMYHLYMQALGNMRMLVPKEVPDPAPRPQPRGPPGDDGCPHRRLLPRHGARGAERRRRLPLHVSMCWSGRITWGSSLYSIIQYSNCVLKRVCCCAVSCAHWLLC